MAANPTLPVLYCNRLAAEAGLDKFLIITPMAFSATEDAQAFVDDLVSKGVLPDTVLVAASQAEAEAGTETAQRGWSPLRVAEAIAALAPAQAVASVVGLTGAITQGGLKTALALVKGDVGLGNVENTALSTWTGSPNITTLGTVVTGTWLGTAIGDSYIASAATWNAKQAGSSNLTTFAGITPSSNIQSLLAAADYAAAKGLLGLGSVENTALSTWTGSTNITTIGTLSGVTLTNASQLAVGGWDSGRGGANGISLVCAVGYELNWQAGYLAVREVGGGSNIPLVVDCDLQANQGTFSAFAGAGVDTDVTLAANSDAKVASQKAVKAYVDANAGGGGGSINFDNAAFVSTANGDDGTGAVGDPSKPFATGTAACDAVLDAGGQVLVIEPGTTSATINHSGALTLVVLGYGADLCGVSIINDGTVQVTGNGPDMICVSVNAAGAAGANGDAGFNSNGGNGVAGGNGHAVTILNARVVGCNLSGGTGGSGGAGQGQVDGHSGGNGGTGAAGGNGGALTLQRCYVTNDLNTSGGGGGAGGNGSGASDDAMTAANGGNGGNGANGGSVGGVTMNHCEMDSNFVAAVGLLGSGGVNGGPGNNGGSDGANGSDGSSDGSPASITARFSDLRGGGLGAFTAGTTLVATYANGTFYYV